jgi:hypothetical protein
MNTRLTLMLAAVIACAAIVGSYVQQTAIAENDFGKTVSDIARDPGQRGTLGLQPDSECGGDGCGDKDGEDDSEGKNFGDAVSGAGSKNK